MTQFPEKRICQGGHRPCSRLYIEFGSNNHREKAPHLIQCKLYNMIYISLFLPRFVTDLSVTLGTLSCLIKTFGLFGAGDDDADPTKHSESNLCLSPKKILFPAENSLPVWELLL